jgi:hypothetical protein
MPRATSMPNRGRSGLTYSFTANYLFQGGREECGLRAKVPKNLPRMGKTFPHPYSNTWT